jgi:hypothetical protein
MEMMRSVLIDDEMVMDGTGQSGILWEDMRYEGPDPFQRWRLRAFQSDASILVRFLLHQTL